MDAAFQAGLTWNGEKCYFDKREVEYWVCIYSEDGIRPDPSKVEVLKYVLSSNQQRRIGQLFMHDAVQF